MKLLSSALIALTLLAGSRAFAQSEEYIALEKDFGKYSSLIIDLQANIEIDASQEAHSTIVGTEADLQSIRWEQQGDALIISAVEGQSADKSIHIVLGGVDLARLESTRESVIYVHHFDGKTLDLDMLNGSVKLEGKVGHLTVNAEKGKVYGSGLESREVEIRIWDQGSVVIHATHSLEAEVSENGKLIYKGSPTRVIKKTRESGVIMSEEILNQAQEVEYVNFGA